MSVYLKKNMRKARRKKKPVRGGRLTLEHLFSPLKINECEIPNRPKLLKDLKEYNVKIRINSTVSEIVSDRVNVVSSDVEESEFADSVVIAAGNVSDNSLVSTLEGNSFKVISVGDACGIRNALEATFEGYKSGFEL